MAARPRDRRRKDWPTGMREPRPGYFTWRHPETGRELSIGRVSITEAKRQVMEANGYLAVQNPTLLERLNGAGNTVSDLLGKMPVAIADNTARSNRSLDKKIQGAMGTVICGGVTVAHCATVVEGEIEAGRHRQAQALRARMKAVFRRGQELGWMEFNPAEPTKSVAVATKRSRLTLGQFKAIYAKAPELCEWLQGAMLVALLTGMDRVTLAKLERSAIGPEVLTIRRQKTGAWVEIPLRLRLDALGMSLTDALAACKSNVISRYVVHHARPHGNAPVGTPIHPDTFSHRFSEARELAGITGDNPPTWHEIRSLAKRLYMKQGGVDTKALLGHASEKMSALYADSRGAEPMRVKLG